MTRTNDPYPPIASYALISECHSSGLVSGDGSVDWARLRRFDAPSTLGGILDWERGGFCSLAQVRSKPADRTYMANTLILESEHRAGHSRARTTDFFAVSYTSHAGEAERVHPYHQMIRIAEGVSGTTEWEFICRPRFEYGIVQPRSTLAGERLALLVGGPEALAVSSSVPLLADDSSSSWWTPTPTNCSGMHVLAHLGADLLPQGILMMHTAERTIAPLTECICVHPTLSEGVKAAVSELRLVEAVATAAGDLGG